MEILQYFLVFLVFGIIFNLIASTFKSLTGKDLSSETFEESKKELQNKVLNSKPANYIISGLFAEENMQQHNFNNEKE